MNEQQCSTINETVYEDECTTVNEEKCEIQYMTKYEQQCSSVSEQVFSNALFQYHYTDASHFMIHGLRFILIIQ